ncbi:hypothetical protein FHW96_001623 [Novosphingobium sp. SG751A]|uniref:hypothetical protein n=1 Tax=Novosphingobium sp. SG751A TaxID=2587000 RepID=UPI0015541AF7|nr:hypothetical protein [Novosphingobium sp. SG751A]NOW45468.1 hypothetical protein [Novosphingobium sp. SG751A]
MSIRALLIVGFVSTGFIAAPAMAQTSGQMSSGQVSAMPLPAPSPAGASYSQAAPGTSVSTAYAAPPAAGLQPGGMQHGPWLAECERRLNAVPGADVSQSSGACQDWWAYYQGGGAPHPTYGYSIPISVMEEVKADCPPQVIEKRVIQRRVIRQKIVRDKRIPI